MVNGISSNSLAYAGANTQTGPGQRASNPKTTSPEADSVKLSATAQARLMLHEAMSVRQIAAELGMTVQALSNSLGLTTTSVATVAGPQASSAKT